MDVIGIIALVGLGWIIVLGLVVMLCVSARNGDRLMIEDAAAEPLRATRLRSVA